MPNLPPCNGPVSDKTGICRWCKHQHEPMAKQENEAGKMVPVYQGICGRDWPDRPIKAVNPEFRTTEVRLMRFRCWRCNAESIANTMREPRFFEIIDRNGILHTTCNHCGAGVDIVKAKILSLADGRAILNRGLNRQQRQGRGR